VPDAQLADAEPADEAEPADVAEGTGEANEPTRVPLPLVGVIAGLIVAAGVIAVLALTGFFASEPEKGPAEDELVAAYQRSRNATYALDGEASRTKPDGSQLVSGALIVQRPPDEIHRQYGSTSGRMNGRRLNCSTVDGQYSCAEGAEVGPWDQMVTHELANLRSYFDSDHPVYKVERQSDGCFELTLVATIADPPYGVRSVMCFDAPTGAMRSIEIEHEGGVIERLEASAIRAIKPDDFKLEGDKAFDPRTGGG
jgi:hypothetical protein